MENKRKKRREQDRVENEMRHPPPDQGHGLTCSGAERMNFERIDKDEKEKETLQFSEESSPRKEQTATRREVKKDIFRQVNVLTWSAERMNFVKIGKDEANDGSGNWHRRLSTLRTKECTAGSRERRMHCSSTGTNGPSRREGENDEGEEEKEEETDFAEKESTKEKIQRR